MTGPTFPTMPHHHDSDHVTLRWYMCIQGNKHYIVV